MSGTEVAGRGGAERDVSSCLSIHANTSQCLSVSHMYGIMNKCLHVALKESSTVDQTFENCTLVTYGLSFKWACFRA